MSERANEVRQQMRNFVEDNFLYLHPDVTLDDGDDLLAQGVIDSLGFVELVDEVQARYAIKVEDVEITEDNFGSVSGLVGFIDRKRPV